jgi:hypothetical protein
MIKLNFDNIEPDYPAEFIDRNENVMPGKHKILSTWIVKGDSSPWKGKKAIKLQMEHRIIPILITEEHLRNSYKIASNKASGLPPLFINEELNIELKIGINNGTIYYTQ